MSGDNLRSNSIEFEKSKDTLSHVMLKKQENDLVIKASCRKCILYKTDTLCNISSVKYLIPTTHSLISQNPSSIVLINSYLF